MAPKWHNKLTAKQLRHLAEVQNNPPTLRELRADIAFQRKTGCRCWECEDIARTLGITIKEETRCQ